MCHVPDNRSRPLFFSVLKAEPQVNSRKRWWISPAITFLSGVIAFGAAVAADPGLPLTEDFANQNLRDSGGTTANWSTSQQAVVLATPVQAAIDFTSAISAIGSETEDTLAVALADLDGDGDLDVIAGSTDSGLRYLNDGTGVFSGTGTLVTNLSGAGNDLAVGDLDGDDDLDFVTARNGQNAWYRNNGSGGFSAAGSIGSELDNTAAVVLGDIDNDGDLDLIAGNAGQTNKVYINISGNFSASGSAIGAETDNTQSLALDDVDGDGDLDLIAGNLGTNRLYLNTGNGSFGASGSALGSESENSAALALGDLDNDGDLDVVTGGDSVANRVYLNTGSGTFSASGTDIGGGSDATSALQLVDLDRDGDLDLLAANNGQSNRLFVNDGTGGFSSAQIVGSGTLNSSALAVGDVDNDGDLDVVVGRVGATNQLVSHPAGGGLQTSTNTIGIETNATEQVALGDLDGDGDLDLLRAVAGLPDRLYFNDGNGSYSATGVALTNETDTTRVVTLGDIDGDGDQDVVTGTAAGQPLKRYLNDGSGTFGSAGSAIGTDTDENSGLALGDIDKDGDLDLLVGNLGGANKLYLNDGNGVFGPNAIVVDSELDQTTDVALGDLDNDGDLDWVVGVANAPNKAYLNTDGVLGAPFNITNESEDTRSIALGDVEGNGTLDVVVGNFGVRNKLYLNDGTANFLSFGIAVGSQFDDTTAVDLVDVDADGDLDVVSGGGATGDLIYFNDGTGDFDTVGTSISLVDGTSDLISGDVDADGDIDVFSANASGQVTRLYINDSSAGFSRRSQPAGTDTDETTVALLGDVDRDGDLDLITGDAGFSPINKVYFNDGNGGFDGAGIAVGANTNHTQGLALGDIDNDGDLDLVAANSFQTTGELNRVYLNDGNGSYSELIGAAGTDTEISTSIALGDVDGDGDLDMVVGNYLQNNKLQLNDGTGNFSASISPISADLGFTESLLLEDFDSDGDLDLVVGNLGVNKVFLNSGGLFGMGTDLSSDSDSTYNMTAGDVDSDGDLDIVASAFDDQNKVYFNNGAAVFSATGVPVGVVADDNLSVDLADIDRDGDLDLVAGTGFGELSRIYRNDGTGTYARLGLPVGDSTDVTNAVVMGDLNNDGRTDLVTVNSFALNRVYLGAQFVTHSGQVASLTVNSGENILTTILTATDTRNTPLTPNTDIDYFLSNNGGFKWHQVYSGETFEFPIPGDDLRWRANLRGKSPQDSPVLSQIEISRINTVPSGTDANVTATEDVDYTFSAADFGYTDADNDPLSFVRITQPTQVGELRLSGNLVVANQQIPAAQIGNLTFGFAANAFGPAFDGLDFTVSDGIDESAAANSLVMDISEVNDAPVANDDLGPDVPGNTGFVQINHGDLLANDNPGPGESDSLSVISVSNAVGGSVSLGPPIGFIPEQGFEGQASFQYTLEDNGTTAGVADPQSDTGVFRFMILAAPNGPPTLASPLPDISRPVGAVFNGALSVFFTDPDSDPLRYTATGLPPSLSLDPNTGQLTGTTTAADLADSPFTIEVTADDQISGTVSDQFQLTLTNQAPQQIIPLGSYQPAAGENRLIDLAPHFVDPDGLPLEFSVSGSTVVSINALGQPGLLQVTADPSQVDQPINVTVTVTDTAGAQIQAELNLLIAAAGAPDFQFERFYPSLQQPWYFSTVSDVAGAPDGTVYLADAERGKVQRFSRDGLLITQWGSLGGDAGQFTLLQLKLAVAPDGIVYVASGGRLQAFERNGRFLFELPDFGEDIVDLTVDDTGQLVLLFDRRVEIRQVDDLSGSLASFNIARDGAALAVGPSGRLYVAVRSPLGGASDQIRVFDPLTLNEIAAERIATSDADSLFVDASEQVFAVGSDNGTLRAYSSGFEFISSDVSSIVGDTLSAITFDTAGRVYLSNGEAVVGLDAGLSMRSLAWQSASGEAGRFDAPSALSVDSASMVYVLDPRRSRVQKFLPEGTQIDQWDLQSVLTDPDNRRVYIHATTDGRVLVTTGDNLEVFDTSGNPASPIDIPGLVSPGPLGETRSGNLVLSSATGSGFTIFQQTSTGQNVGSPFALDTCQLSDLAVGGDNLIYALCEPGQAIREIQVYTQAGNRIRTYTNLPNGNPKALTLDDRDRIHLLGTENEIDLGSGVVTSDSIVRIFQSDGVALTSLGSAGYSAGRFDFGGETAGADIGPSGELVVAEPGNNRVQVFQPSALGRNTKAIVVAGGGDYPENYLWEATQINTNNAYDKLIYQGFTAERILYLHPDPALDLDGNPATSEVDGAPTLVNLAAAFEPGGFAEDADNLVFYLADHGNTDIFRLNPEEVVTASQVAGWIAQLQDNVWPGRTLPPGGFNGWVSVIYEACESGSFQDDLAPTNGVSTNKRLVITTSNDGQNANFIAQGFLSFSYQFWINLFNGFDVREAFDTATLTIKDTYPEQDPVLSVIDRGQRVINLDDYFLQGRPNFNFAGRLVGNGTANSFAGPVIANPIVPANLSNQAVATIEVEMIDDLDGIARAWAVLQPPEYQVRDTANPVLELPTIDLTPNPTGSLPDRFTGTYSNFTTEGDYRVDILAQDVFGNVTKYADTNLTVTVGDPPKNKAIVMVSGDDSERGQAFLSNGDFAYQALLRQNYVNDLDPATPNVTSVADEIRYYTQGQFTGADSAMPTLSQLASLNNAFVDSMTLNLVIYLAADFDPIADAFVLPGIADPITVRGLVSFLDTAEGIIQGQIVVVLEGNDTGILIGRLVDGSNRRFVLSSTGQGGISSLTEFGGVSFSRFFWNAVRDGFSLGNAFQLATDAISAVNSVQTPLLDDNGNGVANELDDQLQSRGFFLGPGITRAGNGPLVGAVAPDLVINSEAVTQATIVAENVSGTSRVSRVVGNVTIPAAALDLGVFDLVSVSQKGGGLINLGDFQGSFSGFQAAGDYRIAVFAIDENGDPSPPQTTTLRKTAGADIYEQDDTPNTGTQTLLGGAAQRHTIHSISAPDPDNDEDWLMISLADEPGRQAQLTFSDLDPGLTLRVQMFDDSRLSSQAAVAVLDDLVSPQGATVRNIAIDDALAGGRYVVRISAESINQTAQVDASPGYLVGLSDPFADLEGELAGRVFDAQTLQPVTAIVQGLDGGSAAGLTFSCFKNCGPLGGEGGFRLRLPQGSYDLEIVSDGYETQTLSGFSIAPGAVTSVTPSPILLQPVGGAQAPSVSNLNAQSQGDDAILLSGVVNANGSQATSRFQLAPAGSTPVPVNPEFLIVGSAAQQVSAVITGLDCQTTYSISLSATNAAGTEQTLVQNVDTNACSATSVVFADGFED